MLAGMVRRSTLRYSTMNYVTGSSTFWIKRIFWRAIQEARLRQKAPQKLFRRKTSINQQVALSYRSIITTRQFKAVTLSSFDLYYN
jgi:hypothetical protein